MMLQRVAVVLLFCWAFLAMADDTVLKLYRPFGDTSDQVSPTIKKSFSGACLTQSKLIVREDAWRCEAAGRIYDPCFVKAGENKTEALCPQSPWVSDSVQIRVTSPLNNEFHKTLDMSRTFPWAIELANGERCQAVKSDEFIDEMRVRYLCRNQNVLFGHIQRCKPVWSMLEKRPDGVVSVDFVRAWF